jgi:hypothetical protein
MGMGIRLLAGLAAVTIAVGAAPAGPAALGTIGLGRWQLHEIGTTDAPRLVCVRNSMQLIQLYHPGIQCTRFTIDDAADHVTIHYTCQGRGYGRTTISVESGDLIKLDTQGIDPEGQPFDKTYEGRRTGACAPPAPPRR